MDSEKTTKGERPKITSDTCKKFDSYAYNGSIVIITKEYSDMHGDIVPVENHISLDRAKEIVANLQNAILCLSKPTNP